MKLSIMAMALIVTMSAEAKTNLFSAQEKVGDEGGPYHKTPNSKPNVNNSPTITNKSPAIQVRSWSMVPQGQSVVTARNAKLELKAFRPGEIIDAVIPMSVIAFSEGKAPVVAEVKRDSRTYILWGDATLEKISKRITIEFSKIREKHSDQSFDFKAQALDDDGTFGLVGEHHTGETKYFVAELLSAAAAGFADASVRRSSGFGGVIDEPSLDTQSKKAFSAAMLKSAERFNEKARSAPEYSVLDGPTRVRVLVSSLID